MKNKKITRKITQGVYVLTTNNGGCVVDAISQVSSGDNPLIMVAVMKSNYTNEILKNNKRFAISVLGEDVNGDIIKTFGLNSMRDIDKFDNDYTEEYEGLKVIKDSIGYMICEIEEVLENDTHTVFIGKMIEADMFNDKKPMSYAYYQENKEEILKLKTSDGRVAWICTICGYIYYGDSIDDNYKCPKCGAPKEMFVKK